MVPARADVGIRPYEAYYEAMRINTIVPARTLDERPYGVAGRFCVFSGANTYPSAFLSFHHGFAAPPYLSEEGFEACAISKSSL